MSANEAVRKMYAVDGWRGGRGLAEAEAAATGMWTWTGERREWWVAVMGGARWCCSLMDVYDELATAAAAASERASAACGGQDEDRLVGSKALSFCHFVRADDGTTGGSSDLKDK